ncbi:hypothetical protein AB1L30_22170 [Bremerella sp. JC817]|uniref:hypothetical protein n=1 Tax=Bremerella sp. JC817 TaxID=3231756 RepID=UPI0034583BDC
MSEPAPTNDSPAKPTWRLPLRISLRLLIVVFTLLCGLLAWGSYLHRVGQLHSMASDKLLEISSRRSYSYRHARIRLSWNYEGNFSSQSISPSNYDPITSRATDLVIYKVKERSDPRWMTQLGIAPIFQRVRTVKITTPLKPEEYDEVVAAVALLDQLDSLELDTYKEGPRFTQAQLAKALGTTRIGQLVAPRSHLTAGPFPELRRTGLVELNLSHTWFSDAAIADLPISLQHLTLERTAVTDAGLDSFRRLRNLRSLGLRRTPTSQQAVDRLRAEMPWCEIYWSPLVDR